MVILVDRAHKLNTYFSGLHEALDVRSRNESKNESRIVRVLRQRRDCKVLPGLEIGGSMNVPCYSRPHWAKDLAYCFIPNFRQPFKPWRESMAQEIKQC